MSEKAFIFPGQGAQYVGMGREFLGQENWADEMWKQADEIVGCNLKDKVLDGPEDELTRTEITQPAIYMTEVVVFKALLEKGISPEITAGHSLGEYAAVVACGALDWRQGLELVKFRGEIFEKTARENPGGMVAVIGLQEGALSDILSRIEGVCEIVNFNSPGQFVISAEKKVLDKVTSRIKEGGAKMAVPLKVSGGFHSSLMDEAVGLMEEKIRGMEFKEPQIGFYSNYSGDKINETKGIKEALINQVNSPVKWIDIIENMVREYGEVDFIEAGPGRVLQGLVKRINRKLNVLGISSPEDIRKLLGGQR
jgi:[acyl-carrier-protein] S-malonyltransferase